MSRTHHEPERVRFVTTDDLQALQSRAPFPEDLEGHPEPMLNSYAQATLDDLDAIVRREIAEELERLGDTTMRLYRNMLRERAEEIRNG